MPNNMYDIYNVVRLLICQIELKEVLQSVSCYFKSVGIDNWADAPGFKLQANSVQLFTITYQLFSQMSGPRPPTQLGPVPPGTCLESAHFPQYCSL